MGLTLDQIANLIARGQLVHSKMVGDAIVEEKAGGDYGYWTDIFDIYQLLAALGNAVVYQDYDADQTLKNYKNLQCFVGSQFLDGATTDPFAQQNPGVIYVTNNIVLNAGFYKKYEFSDVQLVTNLQNYHVDIFPLFGNGPDVQIFTLQPDGSYKQDTGTVPTIVYSTPGDPNTDIVSYTWLYPVDTSGYILVIGASASSGSGGGGSSTPVLPITNNSAVPLSNAELNTLYPTALVRQLVLLPNVPCKYEKLDNSPTGLWDFQAYNPNL